MGREIKFRGMDIKGNWYYGLLAEVPEEYHTQSIPSGIYISNTAGKPFAYRVRPETVGQYIGIEDTNEQMIFEGDTMNLGENKYHCVIEWDNERAEFRARISDKESVGLHSSFWSKGTVTGNIHEVIL